MNVKKLIFLSMFMLSIAVASFYVTQSYTTNIDEQGLCIGYIGQPEKNTTTAGMTWIKPGSFIMGNDKGHKDKASGRFQSFPEERGEQEVALDGFWIDQHEVTNAQFSSFVEATGYQTIAEQKPKKEWFPPGFPEENMLIGSAVFVAPKKIETMNNILQWWQFIEGANWKHPQGPDSDIKDKMNHPVVHVSYQDAQTYANWAGKELPTEAQWEYAARGGLQLSTYTWGDTLTPNKKWMANIWQGQFPVNNTVDDGYATTAPVGCYPANGYGLYDLAGNVWEIVRDNYQEGHANVATINPSGPKRSFVPNGPNTAKHVIKGGSYLCTPDYCMRYRPTARHPQDYTMGTSHIGFRTVLNQAGKTVTTLD